MTYQERANGYVFWQDTLLLPMKKKSPDEKQKYFRKKVEFEDTPNYWEYVCEDGYWNVYYVKRGINRRMAQCNIGEFPPEAIMARIHDKDISITDCRKVEEEHGHQVSRIPDPVFRLSIMYDGRNIMDIIEDKPKMAYEHIKMIIANEGGYVDEQHIVHRGTASDERRKWISRVHH